MARRNKFTVDYNAKTLAIVYKNEDFTYNLYDGDIGDFWHFAEFSNNRDNVNVNFHQEEGELPNVDIYEAIEENGTYRMGDQIDSINEYEVIGDATKYFNLPDGWDELHQDLWENKMGHHNLRCNSVPLFDKAKEMLEANKGDFEYCRHFIDCILPKGLNDAVRDDFRKLYLNQVDDKPKIPEFAAESSFDFEDKEREFDESIIIMVDYGDSTESICTIQDGDNLEAVRDLLAKIKEINENYKLDNG